VHVLNISNPTNAVRVASNYNASGQSLRFSGQHLYAMGFSQVTEVFDVTNPTNLISTHAYFSADYVHDVAEVGDLTFLAAEDAGVKVLRRGSNRTPVLLKRLETEGTGMQVMPAGQYLYYADGPVGLRILDNADSTRPIEVGRFVTSGFIRGVDVAGGYAYVINQTQFESLQIVNVSNPTNPVWAGAMDLWPEGEKIRVRGSYAYLAQNVNGMVIVDVSNPAQLRWLGGYNPGGVQTDLQIAGDLAYLASGTNGLQILRLTTPTNLAYVGGLVLPGRAESVHVAGTRAFLTTPNNGIHLVDVSDAAHPVLVSTFGSLGGPFEVQYAVRTLGQYALVAHSPAGLQVYDVSNARQPVRLATTATGTGAHSLEVAGENIHVVDWAFGVVTLRIPGLIP